MSAKTRLKYSLFQVLKQRKAGSYATRHDRQQLLLRFVDDLLRLGYRIPVIDNLKQKHITAVVNDWQQQGLSTATLKNRLAAIRHLTAILNKSQIVPSNQALGIGARQYYPVNNRALVNPDFSQVRSQHVQASLQLQRLFGLRREESLKIKPHLADKGQYLQLLPSWCKGGRGRWVPIRTDEQRHWLAQAKKIAGQWGNSLIPPDRSYIQQRYVYDKQVQQVGLRNLHGLRHAYAQQRYKELTGWEAPINGGPKSHELTPEQKEIDYRARTLLTEELGHGRTRITIAYLAR